MEIIVFETAYIQGRESLVEENIVIVDGRLSIKEDDSTSIIANSISDFAEQKSKSLNLDISDVPEDIKKRLRGAIKYFSGDRSNVQVYVVVNGEKRPCGGIFLTADVLNIFEEILGKENVAYS